MRFFYITNDVNIAKICVKNNVIPWVDLEFLGKEERQKGMNTVKSKHTIDDIKKIKDIINTNELMVRINPINENSKNEIEEVIKAGADLIMLPMFKTEGEVQFFVNQINGRVKTVLLFETKESVYNVKKILSVDGIDYVHIGLNDLHLSYHLKFMFELLGNGTVDQLCDNFKNSKIKYGYGGIAKLGYGTLPAEFILCNHVLNGSSQVILSRSFCSIENYNSYFEFEHDFTFELSKIRKLEDAFKQCSINFLKEVNNLGLKKIEGLKNV